jgi:UDPglucose--hexose-1-phosphate uridylyltransferase
MSDNIPQLRRNPCTGSVVVIGPGREKSLEQLQRKTARDWSKFNPKIVSGEGCPFDCGHESMTPPEVLAYREKETKPDSEGWWVRVVTNKGPAVDPSIPGEQLAELEVGPFLMTPAFGRHYVIIETVDHQGSYASVQPRQAREIVSIWRDLNHLVGGDRNVKYSFIFQNYGPLAGASQPHPHSQLIALPVIPTRVLNEFKGSREYYNTNRECFFCREISWELRIEDRIVEQTPNFLAWCPYVSKTPYQVVISPKEHHSFFANISTTSRADHLSEFAGLLQNTLKRIRSALKDPDYNLYFHSAPTSQPDVMFYHWHCQIEPVTEAIIAGFEKGSGVFINPRSPESAAMDLRNVKPE